MPSFRLLNPRTIAYYTQVLLLVVPLIIVGALLEQGGPVVKALASILMFTAMFGALEVLRRWFPETRDTVVRLCAPGCAFLGNWIALMFFALMVKLPTSLAAVSDGLAVVGWLGAIIVGQVSNLVLSAYFSKVGERLLVRIPSIPRTLSSGDDDASRMLPSAKLPIAASVRRRAGAPAAGGVWNWHQVGQQ